MDSLYRAAALSHRSRLWNGRALLARGLPAWVHLALTALFFIVLALFLCIGSYTRRVTVSGELASLPGPVRVTAPGQGFIISRLVSAGDKVKKGQPLYEIDVSHTTRSGVVSLQQRQNTQAQIKSVESIINHLRENKRVTLETLEQQKASYAAALSHSADVLNQAEEGLKEMKQNMDSYRRYQRAGLINRDQLSQQAALYYQQQNDLLTLSGQREQNALQLLALTGDIRTRAADFDNDIFRMEMQRSDLVRQETLDDAAGTLVVTSPVDGRVDIAGLTSGQSVSVGDALAQVIPFATPRWELVMWVPDSAVPFIKAGSPVNIRYNAFPAEKFGQFPGRITQISSAPATLHERASWSGAPAVNAGTSETWYRLTVTPDVTHFVWQGHRLRPGNGLRAECTLFLEKRKLWQWVLAPLYDMRDSTQEAVSEQ